MIGHVYLIAALLIAQRDHVAEVVLWHEHRDGDDRLANLLDLRQFGELGRVFDVDQAAVTQHYFVDDGRRRGDQVLVELALETLLDDLHMQQAEKPAAKAETERLRNLGLVAQRRIVQLEFLERLAQGIVLVRLDRIESGEDLRLDFLEPRQGLAGRPVQQGQRIADLGRLQFLDSRDHVTDLASAQGVTRHRLGGEHADLFAEVGRPRGHQANPVLGAQRAVKDPHQHDHTHVVVEPGIHQQRLERRILIALGRWDALDDRFEDVFDPEAGLRRRQNCLGRIDADHVFDLLARVVRRCRG